MRETATRPNRKLPATGSRKYMATAERRRQILDVAAELFSDRGFSGTTTKQIASTVGISEGVLFRHYPTKEILYAAILEDRMPSAEVEQWLGELRELADRRDDEALFTAIAKAILESHRSDPVSHRLILYAALEGHELARMFQLKYSAPVLSFVREYVSRRQAEGAFLPMRPEAVVNLVFGATANFALWNGLGVNPLALSEDEVAAHARTLLTGIRVAAEPS